MIVQTHLVVVNCANHWTIFLEYNKLKKFNEYAVNMGTNNLQLRNALSSCISELNFTGL